MLGLVSWLEIKYSFRPFMEGLFLLFAFVLDFIVYFDFIKEVFEPGEGLIKVSFDVTFKRVLRLLLLLLPLFLTPMLFLLTMFAPFLLYVKFMISKELKLLKFKAKNSCLDVLSLI